MIFKKNSKQAKRKQEDAEIQELVKEINEKEEAEKTSSVQEIAYTRATFWKRCSIMLFDLICCALLSTACYLGIREIVNSTPKMQQTQKFYESKQLESGLFYKIYDQNKIIDSYEFEKMGNEKDPGQSIYFIERDVKTFFTFIEKELGSEKKNEYYDKYLESKLKVKNDAGINLFVKTADGEIIQNPDKSVKHKEVLEKFYKPFIQVDAKGIFISEVPHVYEAQKYISNFFFYLEIPLALFIGFLVIYYIIPLCFFRGKQTLGRLLFHTGLVDSRVLSVSFGRFTARFAIMFFVEVLLSLLTIGIPIFVSFSLMAFSKKKQNFHDYMLGIEEVDVTNDRIFKSMDELVIKPSGYDVTNFKQIDK